MRVSTGISTISGMVLWLAATVAIPVLWVADVSANSNLMVAMLQMSTSTPPRPPSSVQAVVVERILEQTGSPTLMAGGTSVTLETTDLFDVPPDVGDQDVEYTVTSSDPTVAIAEYRNPVVVTPVGPGVATISVASQVGNNTPVTTAFTVMVADTMTVPALPLIGQGLLAALLLGLGVLFRRRRRR